ncbi:MULTISPECIES: response regulator transcription factor [unclassified Undibacterium]|uniref:response regulator transcription factor n=1 Tax=unclassified Undibacterium TaxID=2630295 RepID=UPI002AC8FB45|nr:MULTISPECIES: response regulator transcription factor [unclassified Undibacterium]MEB0140986.1 response regulator transcription factor [Undibacterium sp. CCC2.1]MEB0173456.1 response regulator transcription factor [Undibacterium sp. CCC1.1]MEB0177190.1 response regulator transcription factor [Undibacterium sp. CCC3.4]MEB0216455.1 response regulator transcription factor [Undibacterium sp. 5I2]WPX42049.1 response regulator transcription factor [Undibacterium sp. CCC3.4]
MNQTTPIKLLLVDDHPLVRDGLRARLESVPHFQVCGEAGSAAEALKIIAEQALDLVLMDINLGNTNGISLTARLSQDYPAIAVIMLSMHEKAEYVSQSVQAGARGYVLKDVPAEEIIHAIESVIAGGSYFSAGLQSEANRKRPTQLLTQREQCILESIATGKSNKHIARELSLSVRTIETHRLNIKRKLNIDGQADLIRYAINNLAQ